MAEGTSPSKWKMNMLTASAYGGDVRSNRINHGSVQGAGVQQEQESAANMPTIMTLPLANRAKHMAGCRGQTDADTR